MPSIKDVAQLAGVSIATVSRVMNNLDVVSNDTRAKIELAVKKLGYTPNLAARSLKRQSAKLLGLLVPDIENPYYATLAKHIETEANVSGYSVILCNTGATVSAERHYLKLLAGRLVDGIFLCRSHLRAASVPGAGSRQIPVVMLEKDRENDMRVSVMVDNFQVGELMAEHFLSLGHRLLAYISDDIRSLPFNRRMLGFITLAEAGGAHLPASRRKVTGPQISDGRDAMCELLDLAAGERPTAVYCTNDILAFGAIQAAMKRGLRIPDDISVAGTDNITQSAYMFPALTTIAQPFSEIAVHAMRLLLSGKKKRDDVLLPPKLLVRQSTGPAIL
jgi:Transcriptional regulators